MNHPAHLITRIVGRTKLLLTPFYILSVICFYYLASSMCGQDKLNPELWLASEVGKMVLSWALRLPTVSSFVHLLNALLIDQASLVKMAGYWLHACFASLQTSTLSQSISMPKKGLGWYPGILPSHLDNNPWTYNYLKYVDFVINQGHFTD